MMEFLIDCGADLNPKTTIATPSKHIRLKQFGHASHSKPLNIAASCGSRQVLQILLKRGARLDDDSSALHSAASRGSIISSRIPVLELLLEEGANINAIEPCGENAGRPPLVAGTALQYAAAMGNTDVVKFLLENGADVSVVDTGGFGTALWWAKNPNNMDRLEENEEMILMLTEAEKSTA